MVPYSVHFVNIYPINDRYVGHGDRFRVPPLLSDNSDFSSHQMLPKHSFPWSLFLFSALTAVPICQWFLTGESGSSLYEKEGSVHCFHVTPPGTGWVWGGPPAGWACVSAPTARATSRRTPVLTTAKPAQEEPSRVSLRKHRISPPLRTPGKSGRSRNTRPSCRRPPHTQTGPGG